MLIYQQVQHLGQGQPGTQGFQVANHNLPFNCRRCVFPSDAEGMNQGTEARILNGSGANSRQMTVV